MNQTRTEHQIEQLCRPSLFFHACMLISMLHPIFFNHHPYPSTGKTKTNKQNSKKSTPRQYCSLQVKRKLSWCFLSYHSKRVTRTRGAASSETNPLWTKIPYPLSRLSSPTTKLWLGGPRLPNLLQLCTVGPLQMPQHIQTISSTSTLGSLSPSRNINSM